MDIGIFLLMQSPEGAASREVYARAVRSARLAESLGFSHLWVAEHHFINYSYSSQPFVLLAHIAALTERIRLGTAIVPLPLHNPLLVAEQAAAVDLLSGGRLELGIGKGYQRFQYERLGVEKSDDHAAYEEAIDLLRRALGGRPFSFEGRRFAVPETLIYPQPLQDPVPVWAAVNSTVAPAVEATVARGINLFSGTLEPISKLVDMRRRYADAFAAAPGAIRIGTQRPVYVSESEAEARVVAEEARWNARAGLSLRHEIGGVTGGRVETAPLPGEPSTDEILAEHMVVGTPEQCIRQLERILAGSGADLFNGNFCFGAMTQDQVERSMRLFAEAVMPVFRPGGAGRARPCRPEHARAAQGSE
ncbi:MAG: LLM class flavin-dependent oxidoreductase [Tistlia sp.]|uniref:LLM class flavin-dependent oxidoreductase n=1 Tax=Tistlia sp. TaxID=3057121 RepID=UPI0034A4420B